MHKKSIIVTIAQIKMQAVEITCFERCEEEIFKIKAPNHIV